VADKGELREVLAVVEILLLLVKVTEADRDPRWIDRARDQGRWAVERYGCSVRKDMGVSGIDGEG
jgi:hypothetical protein